MDSRPFLVFAAAAALLVIGLLALYLRRRRARAPASSSAESNSHVPQPGALDVIRAASYARATGSGDRAVYVLTRYLQRSDDRAARPEPWEMLLDLYHESGRREEFDKTAEAYGRRMGTGAPTFEQWPDGAGGSRGGLEQSYPQLVEQLRRTWKEPRALQIVDGVLRECGRPGRPRLSSECVTDLLALQAVLRGREAGSPTGAEAGKEGPDERYLSAIESQFPRIAAEITRLWPGARCHRYLDGLIIDDRGNRRGFDQEVMAEILFLREILELIRPQKQDPWEEAVRP
ncbi:MAG TPA: hypothetical protein VFA86_01330 [Gammaproteobacteria bacterium]|nr:hypothetical protein [Gammaproteobacteria bacterium]